MSTLDVSSAWETVAATVTGYLRRRLHSDAAMVEDLTQEVFLRLRRSLGSLQAVDRLGPWASRITRSVLIDHLRQRRNAAELVDEHAAPSLADDEGDEVKRALASFVVNQVEHLPPHEASAIRLVDLDGIAPRQAADLEGIGLPALKARLRRGRNRLFQAIERCCEVSRDVRGQPITCEPRVGSPVCAACS